MKQNLLLILLSLNLMAEGEVGCQVVIDTEAAGCSMSNVLNNPEPLVSEQLTVVHNKTMAIRENLDFVVVEHNDEKVRISRDNTDKQKSCPPFCIEPMYIDDVQTIGELETLDFIDKLKNKEARLLIDVRESKMHQDATIPGAINVPSELFMDGSKYQEKVLILLGAKKSSKKAKKQWSFKNAQSLLIFGSSSSTNEASQTIKQLLGLGYPSAKLYYYRAGIEQWKSVGLTVYSK